MKANIERINENEARLDKALECIRNLEKALSDFVAAKADIQLLNEYYGSKEWFCDKEAYEGGKIPRVKAGVLSEDSVWNMNESISNIKEEMQSDFI